ncbi:glycosyltransferase [Falsirhodobacter sp. 20TX0035]|uniref:glycosyltransferase n=1 Tax=Falsirhodobacter sp. 20TX0035 TaxID=3022019 RepID=UPI00232F2CF6|nr:glycosyltransferase [Falsirhodobacter sp. 20TX0035]MDB6453011.1 glycosyltransferase [Falsirhodobacter sp. 20TX0035]
MNFIAFCPPYASHLRAFMALADGLRARGHRVTFVLPGQVHMPWPGAVPETLALGTEVEDTARTAIERSVWRTDTLCRHIDVLPPADAILGDQTEPAGGLIADALGLPLISVACALPFEREPGIPLPFLGWPFDESRRGRRRNVGGERVARLILRKQNAVIAHWADRFAIGPRRELTDCLSPLLTLSQTLPGFDFPRRNPVVLETGPLRPAGTAAFPDDIRPDPSRPFVYASLGTIQGHREAILRRIVAACHRAGAQVLVSHAGGLSDSAARDLGATWVRNHVPQEAVLDRADLCITHAGLNTAMEALVRGVPMLAIPIAYDQPGVAARLVHHGVGLRHSRHWLDTGSLVRSISRLLNDPGFRERARAFRPGGGVPLAVARIEDVVRPAPQLVAAQ